MELSHPVSAGWENYPGHHCPGPDITERKQAEEALQKSEKQYRELADSIADPFFVLNTDLRFTFWNQASAKNTGIPADAIIDKFLFDVFPELKRDRSSREVITGGQAQFLENRWDRQMETYHDVSVYPTTDGIAVFSRDITERIKTESKLAYLASYPERNPNPVMEVDLDGRILYANPAVLALLPDLGEQGLAHPWLADWKAVVHPFIQGQTDTGMRDITVGERSYQQAFYYSAQDRFVRIYGFDITERKQAEEALSESEHHLQLALEGAGGGMMFRDSDGVWQFTPQINVLLGR